MGRVLLLLLGLVIGVALALEGGLRVFREEQLGIPRDERLFYRHHPRLGWMPEPGSARELTGARRVHVTHNLEGFRDRDHGAKRRPRLLFVGDSYVWGYDVEASERFSDLLQARLAGVEVLNLGVSGYGTDQEYLLLQEALERYDPDWVVLVMGPNDTLDNRRNHVSGRTWKPWFALDGGELVPKGIPVPASLAYVQREHPILLSSFLVRAGVQAFLRLTGPVPQLQPDDPSEALVAAAGRLVRDHGAEFGLAWVGTRGLPDDVTRWLEGQVGPQAASLRFPVELCRREEIPCLDLSHDLTYPSHGWHWTPEGHREVAERLLPFLQDQGWLAETAGLLGPVRWIQSAP